MEVHDLKELSLFELADRLNAISSGTGENDFDPKLSLSGLLLDANIVPVSDSKGNVSINEGHKEPNEKMVGSSVNADVDQFDLKKQLMDRQRAAKDRAEAIKKREASEWRRKATDISSNKSKKRNARIAMPDTYLRRHQNKIDSKIAKHAEGMELKCVSDAISLDAPLQDALEKALKIVFRSVVLPVRKKEETVNKPVEEPIDKEPAATPVLSSRLSKKIERRATLDHHSPAKLGQKGRENVKKESNLSEKVKITRLLDKIQTNKQPIQTIGGVEDKSLQEIIAEVLESSRISNIASEPNVQIHESSSGRVYLFGDIDSSDESGSNTDASDTGGWNDTTALICVDSNWRQEGHSISADFGSPPRFVVTRQSEDGLPKLDGSSSEASSQRFVESPVTNVPKSSSADGAFIMPQISGVSTSPVSLEASAALATIRARIRRQSFSSPTGKPLKGKGKEVVDHKEKAKEGFKKKILSGKQADESRPAQKHGHRRGRSHDLDSSPRRSMSPHSKAEPIDTSGQRGRPRFLKANRNRRPSPLPAERVDYSRVKARVYTGRAAKPTHSRQPSQ